MEIEYEKQPAQVRAGCLLLSAFFAFRSLLQFNT
jgi:hypothetical protein